MRKLTTDIRTWGEMVKFSHSIFALPFAVLATFMAARPQLPRLGQFLLIVVCMVAARSAAMTFNRIADARIDADNPRTAGRPLPSGRISPAAAWAFFLTACLCFVAGCGGFRWLYHNSWPLLLSLPVLAALCCYSFTKRFTQLSHVALGAAIAIAPVAAWIAISPETLGAPALLLMAAVTFWIGGFDIIYACQDVDFDRGSGLHSLPAGLGVTRALLIARVFHVLTIASLTAAGLTAGLGTIYYVGVGCMAVLLIVENSLVRPNDLSHLNLAFFTVNGIVGVVLGGLGVLDVWLSLPGAR